MAEKKKMNALMLGDVCGQPGMRALFVGLKDLVKETHADFVVANGENAAGGFGLSVSQMTQLFSLGVDVITSGNHIWQQSDIIPFLDSEPRLLRPANYGNDVPGHGFHVASTRCGLVATLNLQGRAELPSTDNPFTVGLDIVRKLRKQTPLILVDFHAEATDEKEALAFLLDGKVSAVVGTHTHVQTADERIQRGGTAFITDLGMCGPRGSVIGSTPALSIQKQLTQMPLKNPILEEGGMINGLLITIDGESGKALECRRVRKNYL